MYKSFHRHICIPLSKRHFFCFQNIDSKPFQNQMSHLADFHFTLPNGTVSQLVIEFPRTLKGKMAAFGAFSANLYFTKVLVTKQMSHDTCL